VDSRRVLLNARLRDFDARRGRGSRRDPSAIWRTPIVQRQRAACNYSNKAEILLTRHAGQLILPDMTKASRPDTNEASGTSPDRAQRKTGAPIEIDTRDLMGAERETTIIHFGERYRLRITSNNKLILTK
jgi:hemin uptake protein HemP